MLAADRAPTAHPHPPLNLYLRPLARPRRALSVSTNALSGTIPTSLSALTALTGLWVDSNQLTGSIPTRLGLLDKLVYVHQARCTLNGCCVLRGTSPGAAAPTFWVSASETQCRRAHTHHTYIRTHNYSPVAFPHACCAHPPHPLTSPPTLSTPTPTSQQPGVHEQHPDRHSAQRPDLRPVPGREPELLLRPHVHHPDLVHAPRTRQRPGLRRQGRHPGTLPSPHSCCGHSSSWASQGAQGWSLSPERRGEGGAVVVGILIVGYKPHIHE
jgi:hypothetical protein